MTLCLGALAADRKAIVCVADKGLSYGDGIQWDSDSTKIVPIGTSGVRALISGDEFMISRVLRNLASVSDFGRDALATIKKSEEAYRMAESEIIEAVFLQQHTLKTEDYNNAITAPQINTLIESIAVKIDQERQERNYTSCAMLLCGFDSDKKPFILHLDSPGLVMDLTHTGHGAVGSGFERAISRLLWSDWKAEHPLDRVVYDIFDAKADAEMNPFVGSDWDTVIITEKETVILPKEQKNLVERAWVKNTRSPWETHDPDTDLPEPPADWKEQLEKYCNALLD